MTTKVPQVFISGSQRGFKELANMSMWHPWMQGWTPYSMYLQTPSLSSLHPVSPYQCAGVPTKKAHTMGGLNSRNLFSHTSGHWRSRSRLWKGWVLLKPVSMACRRPSSPRGFTCLSLCVCLCPDLLIRTPVRLDHGPPTLLISFCLNYPFFFSGSHLQIQALLRCWPLGS